MVAEYYPRPHDPVSGVWAHRQALATRAAGAEVRVVVLERPLPALATVKAAVAGSPAPLVGALRDAASVPGRMQLDGIDVDYVRYLSPPRERGYARWHRYARRALEQRLRSLWSCWRPDVVHAHYALPAGGAVREFAREQGTPLVVSVHGGDILGRALASPPARASVAEVLRGAERVLCNSGATLRRARLLAGRGDNMTVVRLGAEIPDELPPKPRDPTIVTLAHVIPRKRHCDVLRAIALLRDELPDLQWTVIGDGPALAPLRALARQLALAERVSLRGELAPAEALDELARSDLMAMPSVDEAFGVAYVEALARGVPVIGCRGEGGPEEIGALGDGVLLVPPRDPEALARSIAAALSDRDALARLGIAGRETVRRHFSWGRCGEATVAAYRMALGRSP